MIIVCPANFWRFEIILRWVDAEPGRQAVAWKYHDALRSHTKKVPVLIHLCFVFLHHSNSWVTVVEKQHTHNIPTTTPSNMDQVQEKLLVLRKKLDQIPALEQAEVRTKKMNDGFLRLFAKRVWNVEGLISNCTPWGLPNLWRFFHSYYYSKPPRSPRSTLLPVEVLSLSSWSFLELGLQCFVLWLALSTPLSRLWSALRTRIKETMFNG